jgi:hypothetical protein
MVEQLRLENISLLESQQNLLLIEYQQVKYIKEYNC